MIRRRRILTTWKVGQAWEVFSREQAEVVIKSFRILGLVLAINGTCDDEISVKGIESAYLVEVLKEWERVGLTVIDLEEDAVESDVEEVDEDVLIPRLRCAAATQDVRGLTTWAILLSA